MKTSYEFRVTLTDFKRRIYRIIRVNGSMTIEDFCEAVIYSMNGDCYHLYALEFRGERFLCNGEDIELYDDNEQFMKKKKISFLRLNKGDRLKINYDFGDDWYFLLTVRKVLEEESNEYPIVLDGKGLGIVEDCGGIWGLEEIINEDISSERKEAFGDINIDEFDLDECNCRIK